MEVRDCEGEERERGGDEDAETDEAERGEEGKSVRYMS